METKQTVYIYIYIYIYIYSGKNRDSGGKIHTVKKKIETYQKQTY